MAGPISPTHRDRPLDTSEEAWTMVTERWRTMTPVERATQLDELCQATEQLAIAGIRHTEGADVSDERIRYLLTMRRYGRELADAAFGPEPVS